MPFAENILSYRSVAVVGMAKNVGKTECLNYILRRTANSGHRIAITSIGVDGESSDRVTLTAKPEIVLNPGMIFATSEKHFLQRLLEAEILDISSRRSALGRIVAARALSEGKSLISGPADTYSLRKLIDSLLALGAETVIVDGALSRLSPASPAVTDALVLSTGAALSIDPAKIAKQTLHTCSLIALPAIADEVARIFNGVESGIRFLNSDGYLSDPGISSALELEKLPAKDFPSEGIIFVSGMVTDRMMQFIASRPMPEKLTLLVRDFTRFFIKPETLTAFGSKGINLRVIHAPKLLGVTVNPKSPAGYCVDSRRLQEMIASHLSVPVIDVCMQQQLNR